MSKRRVKKSAYRTPLLVDSMGQPLCRYCRTPVKPPKKTFCSPSCVHEWKVRTNPGYARSCCFKRDKGFCCQCGLDTQALLRRLIRMTPDAMTAERERLGIKGHRDSLWDADHILPVAHGGGECGLENLQTLCWKCHDLKTADQARERLAKKNGLI